MEIRIEIGTDGNVVALAMSACEDLLHDYMYFIKTAKQFDPESPQTLFLHKRYLRAGLLTFFAYIEAVLNRWLYLSVEKAGRVSNFEKLERSPLENKIRILESIAGNSSTEHTFEKLKKLRNLVVHFKPGRDAEFFEQLTAPAFDAVEHDIAQWLTSMESLVGIKRHEGTKDVIHGFASEFGNITADVSSNPQAGDE